MEHDYDTIQRNKDDYYEKHGSEYSKGNMLRDFGRSPLFSPTNNSSTRRGIDQTNFGSALVEEKPNVTKFFENNNQI